MKLLIVTQKVDRADPVLGFFHKWILKFLIGYSQVSVVCQSYCKGNRLIPSEIHIFPLGKADGKSRFWQVFRFWKLVWKLRRDYDTVFVHMTPIWIVLGAPFWFLLKKPMYLWYEARGTRWPLHIALMCVRKVFSASLGGIPLQTSKSVITGHGIDTVDFTDGQADRQPSQFITVGRITRAKRLGRIFECMQKLPEGYSCSLFGTELTSDDAKYRIELEKKVEQHNLQNKVQFHEPIPQSALVTHLQQASLFLHASTTALDKAVLEAMACGCIVVSTNPTVHAVLPEECRATDDNFAEKVKRILEMPEEAKKKLREKLRKEVVEHHSLTKLIERLVKEMTE